MAKPLLKDPQKRFVVQCLACFETPQYVAALVKEKFGVEITRQAVECYDPTKVAGSDLKEELREVFKKTRAAYLEEVSSVGIANKIVRLRTLERLAGTAESLNNFRWAAHLIKQARDEVEGINLPAGGGKTPPGGGKDKPSPSLKVTIEHGAGARASSDPAREAGDGAGEPGD